MSQGHTEKQTARIQKLGVHTSGLEMIRKETKKLFLEKSKKHKMIPLGVKAVWILFFPYKLRDKHRA